MNENTKNDGSKLLELTEATRKIWCDVSILLRASERLLSDKEYVRNSLLNVTEVSGAIAQPQWWTPHSAMYVFHHKNMSNVTLLVSAIFGDRFDTGRLSAPVVAATLLTRETGHLESYKQNYRLFFGPLCDENFIQDGAVRKVSISEIDPEGVNDLIDVSSLVVPITSIQTNADLKAKVLDPICSAAKSVG